MRENEGERKGKERQEIVERKGEENKKRKREKEIKK
jgi:hypothetical protein